MSESELKRCPFCNGKAKIETDGSSFHKVFVYCQLCGVRTLGDDTTEMAIFHWNRRTKGR